MSETSEEAGAAAAAATTSEDEEGGGADVLNMEELRRKWDIASGPAFSAISEEDVPRRIAEFSKSVAKRIEDIRRKKLDGKPAQHNIGFTSLLGKSSDLESFMGLEHTKYRWVVEYKNLVSSTRKGETPIHDMNMIAKSTQMTERIEDEPDRFPSNFRMVLQVNLAQEEEITWDRSMAASWIDWIYLRNKRIDSERIGISVFAARRFNPGTELGVLVGEKVWEASVVGSKAIPKEDLPEGYFCKYDGRTMKQTVIRSQKSLSPSLHDSLCMGFQFIRHANGLKRKRASFSSRDPTGAHNVAISDVGIVQVVKTIQKDGEILTMAEE